MKAIYLTIITNLILFCSCERMQISDEKDAGHTMYTNAGGKINTLDPALASDLTSSMMVMSIYDTLLQYDYVERPYKLIPSMLESMPEISPDSLHYKFRLRNDLYFQKNQCFKDEQDRKITSKDVIFSFLRLADARVHSSGFWLWRGKIKGIDDFYAKSSVLKPGDMSIYDEKCPGFEIIDDANFAIHLVKPDPRLLYMLAMSYSAVVSRKVAISNGNSLTEVPAGSGPFQISEWQKDYKLILLKNSDYRKEFFAQAQNPLDRTRQLPLLDKIVCYQVKQPTSSWLLFLQGEIDLSSLDNDNRDAVATAGELVSGLKERGIRLLKIPHFEIIYIGFGFSDPLLSGNLELRKAISLAYDIGARVKHSKNSLVPVNGPIPPNVAGHDSSYVNPYGIYNLEKAKEHLAKAGFPGGINPATGKPLAFSFDLPDTTSAHRQLAELMKDDMRKIGIEITPFLNNKPRFLQKLKEGQSQLFRYSWIGDYPDAENFLQVFCSKNIGGSNKAGYNDPEFDRMFQEIVFMPDCPERTEKYRKMAIYLTEKCPWIFESNPTSYLLMHGWLENYLPHDFAFARWKYVSIDPEKRAKAKNSFKPLKMSELRNPQEK